MAKARPFLRTSSGHALDPRACALAGVTRT
jgi:hypothetical protein